MVIDELSRRLQDIARSVPPIGSLPTLDQLNWRTVALIDARDPLVKVRRVGISAGGEPIEMISIGHSPRSALVVGTPHPNEPIGCLTVEFMIDLLRQDAALRDALGFTWHFIKSIEPDGLRLNEGWLATPHDPLSYLQHFYRPAARYQAEYAFPLSVPGYRFDAPTPENLAWQEAIRLTRPELLYSLHNCEFGGAFYLLSRDHPSLASDLLAGAQMLSVGLEQHGDALEGASTLAPGVFKAFDVAAMLKSGGSTPGWNAGQSSFEYCAHIGTFGLITETPQWRSTPTGSRAGEPTTVPDAQTCVRRWSAEVAGLLDRHLPSVPRRKGLIAERFQASIEEWQAFLRRRSEVTLGWDPALPVKAIVDKTRAGRLNVLRPVGMLLQAALAAQADGHTERKLVDAVDAARGFLRDALAGFNVDGGIEPMPLHQSVGLQVLAGLQAAVALR